MLVVTVTHQNMRAALGLQREGSSPKKLPVGVENVAGGCLVPAGRVVACFTKVEKLMKNVYFYSKAE